MGRVLTIIKPDAWFRKIGFKLAAEFESRFEILRISFLHQYHPVIAIKLPKMYAEHVGRDYWQRLIDHMTSGPLLVLGLREASVGSARGLTEAIRDQYDCTNPKNLVHCSDSPEAGEREFRIWFGGDA